MCKGHGTYMFSFHTEVIRRSFNIHNPRKTPPPQWGCETDGGTENAQRCTNPIKQASRFLVEAVSWWREGLSVGTISKQMCSLNIALLKKELIDANEDIMAEV